MKKKEDKIKLSKEQMKTLVPMFSEYISENFEIEAGNLQVELLIEFFLEKAGSYCYNKAVEDCMEYMAARTEDMFILLKEEKLK